MLTQKAITKPHLRELPDVEEYVLLKRTVISQLSLSEAEECYQLWGHISCNTYLAHRYVDKILAEQRPSLDTSSLDSMRNTLAAEGKNSDIVEVSFQPLAAFFRHLHKSDRPGTSERGSPLHFQALEEVALQHTHHETTYDMGTVNF
ncbi:hypothetical protein DPMN_121160 [Dreissena polymorpha]|uniref:Uncharacterized protein n=1 Tax=Dreissena polymorpha TaxID=45954 RepID=A0A9D4JP75_DREPO|nr:hypothetical protein DPMN_121160 [Dreissena polymorpha]